MQLMTIADKMTALGWRIDLAALERHRATATQRVSKFLKVFLAETGLVESALGAAGSGATNAVRDWFWIDQGAPHVVFAKLTGKPQFSTECIITYATQYAQEPFGRAAAALYGLRKNKKLLEFCETYRVLSQRDHRIHFSMNPAGTQTGRWTSSTRMRLTQPDGTRTTVSGNVQQVPSKTPSFDFGEGKEKLVESLRDIFVADEGCVLLKCVTPDMRVLTSDLRWVPAGELKKGQELIGFDEDPAPIRRYFKPSKVTAINSVYKRCYRVTTSMGTLTCSEDHKWLAATPTTGCARKQKWIEAKDLKQDYTITYIVEPFEEDRSYDAGFLAGFLEGEGHCVAGNGQVGFSQNPGLTFDAVKAASIRLGFNFQAHTSKNQRGCLTVRYGGEQNTGLRVLGILRPPRLLKKFAETWKGKSIFGKLARKVTVKKIEYIGVRKCVAFATTTKTFICEGYASHNCDFNALELRLIAYIHGARKLMGWIDAGEDTHIQNAIGIFRELRLPADAKQVKPAVTELQKLINDARDAAKPLAYAVSYQMHDPRGNNRYPTLFKTLKKIFPTITEEIANLYAARFFELHPEIKDGQTRIRAQIERDGFTTNSIDGRRLYYPSSPRGQNQALNFHMQSTGAALINRALLAIAPRLDWRGQAIRAQVHDELVVHCPLKDLDKIADMVEECMGAEAQLGETVAGVPAEADPGFDWGNTMSRPKFKELLRGRTESCG